MPQEENPDLWIAIFQLDFVYTYSGPEGRAEENMEERLAFVLLPVQHHRLWGEDVKKRERKVSVGYKRG